MESTSLIVKPSYCFSPSVWKAVMVRESLSARGCFTEFPSELGNWSLGQKSTDLKCGKGWIPLLNALGIWRKSGEMSQWLFGGSPGDLHPQPASSMGWLRAAPNTPGKGSCSFVLKPSPGAPLACSGSSSAWKGSWSRDNWGVGNWPCKGEAPCCSSGYSSCLNAFDSEEKKTKTPWWIFNTKLKVETVKMQQ